MGESLVLFKKHVLFLKENQIGDAGTIALSEALKTKTEMVSVSLGNHGLCFGFCSFLFVHCFTVTFFLTVGEKGAKALASMLKGNTTLLCLMLQGISFFFLRKHITHC